MVEADLPGLDSAEIVHIDGDDKAVAKMLREISREVDRARLVITTDETGPVADLRSYRDWTTTLLRYDRPLVHLGRGPLGPRSLAFMLCAHVTLLPPDAKLRSGWEKLPGLSALLHRRLGAQAHGILFGLLDPLECAIAVGIATPDVQKWNTCVARLHSESGRSAWSRNVAALRAAHELPFREAFDFGCSFRQAKEAP